MMSTPFKTVQTQNYLLVVHFNLESNYINEWKHIEMLINLKPIPNGEQRFRPLFGYKLERRDEFV